MSIRKDKYIHVQIQVDSDTGELNVTAPSDPAIAMHILARAQQQIAQVVLASRQPKPPAVQPVAASALNGLEPKG